MNPPKSADAKKLTLPRVPDGLMRKVLWCILAIRRVAAAAGVNLQIVGSSRASTNQDGQVQLKVEGGGGTTSNTDATPVWGIRPDGKIAPGTIAGRIPTYLGTPISPVSAAAAVPTSGSHTLWLHITFSLNKDSAGFITSQSVSSVTIQNTAPVTSESLKGQILIESVSGVWTQPWLSSSQSAVLCNTGPNETQLTLLRS